MSNHFYSRPSNGLSDSSTAPGPVAHSPEELFQCMWGYPHGLHCNDLIRGTDLPNHLREIHEIRGKESARAECKWNHCGREFNIGSLCEHVEEMHMGIAYFCDCGSKFSRRDTLSNHKKNCSG
ncbi:uncharacterized protein F5891DRAFT_1189010 [Suillus fuscotomentosus]|uniref:C2H2-type domain-containing protein n=1 Tax=Suillus fuscotomentosus TaxID=1912939 RepID=A0AAD4HJG8_9AGAM|nr:uncharacterized protein F5891DRAFT_1189010 [Suillus fuscotomentosus]KAG1899925.1 hypothetical protein F5891DRAFT_1189010 [Suillus fuscotomentosus]